MTRSVGSGRTGANVPRSLAGFTHLVPDLEIKYEYWKYGVIDGRPMISHMNKTQSILNDKCILAEDMPNINHIVNLNVTDGDYWYAVSIAGVL